jgi:ribosomal protein L37AE/L43A
MSDPDGERLERYREQHALLLAAVDVDALDDPECPACGEGPLVRESGLTWARAVCRDCGTTWQLDG